MDHFSNGHGAIFVYGTLKHDQRNFLVIADDVLSHEEAFIEGTMYDLGPYPGVVLNGENIVKGELMIVKNMPDVIRRLDALEGYRPDDPKYCHYNRRTVDVAIDGGRKRVKAYTYEIIDRYGLAEERKPVVVEWFPNEYWTRS